MNDENQGEDIGTTPTTEELLKYVGPMSVTEVVLKEWEQTLREWYAANPPPGPLIYHYCERMTACTAPMTSALFDEIYNKLAGPGSKVKAVKLTMTFGDTVCKPGEQFSKELGRMEAWRRAKHIDLWVRDVKIRDGLVTMTAYEDESHYGGHLSLEFTRWHADREASVRTRIRQLSAHFSRCKSYNEKWRR